MRLPSDELAALDAAHLRRRLRNPSTLLNFSSNDYLGLANDDALKALFAEAIGKHGVGSGASRLVCGTHAPHLLLEETLAAFKGTEAALTFSSGYAGAVGIVSALMGKDDIIILDKLCHASLVDGARLSGATLRIFPHNDVEKLASHLAWAETKRTPETRVLILTESVFSMDGDTAPLQEIVALKQAVNAWLLVDEAHALGIHGRDGRGWAEALGVANSIDLHFGTLSKAVGLSGGYVCASRDMIDLLINKARSFIYSTAPPPAIAATAAQVIGEWFPSARGEELRRNLWTNLHRLAAALPQHFSTPQSAILPFIVGEESAALAVSQQLEAAGLLVPAIRYPTVAKGSARLRITISARHAEGEIQQLCNLLETIPAVHSNA